MIARMYLAPSSAIAKFPYVSCEAVIAWKCLPFPAKFLSVYFVFPCLCPQFPNFIILEETKERHLGIEELLLDSGNCVWDFSVCFVEKWHLNTHCRHCVHWRQREWSWSRRRLPRVHRLRPGHQSRWQVARSWKCHRESRTFTKYTGNERHQKVK